MASPNPKHKKDAVMVSPIPDSEASEYSAPCIMASPLAEEHKPTLAGRGEAEVAEQELLIREASNVVPVPEVDAPMPPSVPAEVPSLSETTRATENEEEQPSKDYFDAKENFDAGGSIVLPEELLMQILMKRSAVKNVQEWTNLIHKDLIQVIRVEKKLVYRWHNFSSQSGCVQDDSSLITDRDPA